ncbi:MAG: lactate racemase domain-containing protein [Candidatus Bathyarchaeota archaeon]|nr:lactate racemase domain-containing protein [Candidatus Bathyarchaeota archaeon]
MVEVWLPYGKTEVHVSVPLRNLIGTVEPGKGHPLLDPREAIVKSLQDPIESESIENIAKPGNSIVIAIDGTMAPSLAVSAAAGIVETLWKNDVPSGNLSLLIGNGLRGRSNPDLFKAIEASEHLQNIRLIDHSRGTGNLTSIGKTTNGTEVEISSAYAKADVRIVVGETLLDHFSGLRGAHSTVVPALAGQRTITANRSLSLTGEIVPGITEENLVHSDVMEAALMARVDFALHLLSNGRGELVSAFSGNLEQAWSRAVAELGDSHKVKAEANADVIVVGAGGSRFDFDLYNSVWALNGVSDIAKRGASIILIAECTEGLGAEGLSTLSQVDTLSELRRRYMLGARAVYLIKSIMRRNEVVLVSALPGYLAEPLGFSVERTANDALKEVFERRRGRRTMVVTHGCSTIPFVA